jgi:hypothetical protein
MRIIDDGRLYTRSQKLCVGEKIQEEARAVVRERAAELR